MFHQHCGEGVTLRDNSRTAEERTGDGSVVVLSQHPLTRGQPFLVGINHTWHGDQWPLCLGVTSRDPDTRPELPEWAWEMKDSWCVMGTDTHQDGEETGQWGGYLRVSPGDKAGVVWDGQVVSIIMNGTTTQVFTNVPGPVWALTDVSWGVSKMSIVRPDASKCHASGRGLRLKGTCVGDDAVFMVNTKGAGYGDLKVTITGTDATELPILVKEIGICTYEVAYKPSVPDHYIITVLYGESDIPESPFIVEVQTSKIKAFGPGLEGGVLRMPACFTLETNGETGTLDFAIEGPSKSRIIRNRKGDGSTQVAYWPTALGEYVVHILCEKEDIPKSPYKANIVPNNGQFYPSKVTAEGAGLEVTGFTVNKQTEFIVDTSQAGQAELHITVMDADYSPVDVVINDNHDGTYCCHYTPTAPLKHTINISYGGVNIPQSPFRVRVQEASIPSKVKVYGPAVEGPVKTFKPTYLTVDVSEAGPGYVTITLANEQGQEVPFKTTSDKNTCRIDFQPTTVNVYKASVFFAEQEIPTSPFKIYVQPSMDISKVNVMGFEASVFLESTIEFTVNAKSVTETGAGEVKTFVTSPSGTLTEASANNNNDGTYKCMYTTFEQGLHEIEVTYERLQIPNSPFTVHVKPGCDPSRVKAYGPGLEGGYTNTPHVFTVETRSAGQGGLDFVIEGPAETKKNCRYGRNGCTVKYTPTKPGDYDISVTFNDQHIPGSPFKVAVIAMADIGKVRCYGPGLELARVKKYHFVHFVVDATKVDTGPLDVMTTDSAGIRRPAHVHPRGDGNFDCSYYPEIEGSFTVDVKYAGQHLPQSPFKTLITPASDASEVKVYGNGIKKQGVLASVPVSFVIDAKEAGLADLDVLIQDSAAQSVATKIQENANGTYTVTYNPEDVGPYTISVKFGGQGVPNSPFTIQASDASKLKKEDEYFDSTYDRCFCMDCTGGQNIYSARGNPPEIYILPQGWCRFSLRGSPKALGLEIFKVWHVAYHGTVPQNIGPILASDLLIPGDHTLDGKELKNPDNHFNEDIKPKGFDTKQVFVTPSIIYAGQQVYAKKQRWVDPETRSVRKIQVALQVRIKPDSYAVGKETLALSYRLDPKIDNGKLEWSTKNRGAIIITGILVKFQ